VNTEYYLHPTRGVCTAYLIKGNMCGIYWPEREIVTDSLSFSSTATTAFWWGQLANEVGNLGRVREDLPLPAGLGKMHEECQDWSLHRHIVSKRLTTMERQVLVNLLQGAGDFAGILNKIAR
jgi:hypothetical protein